MRSVKVLLGRGPTLGTAKVLLGRRRAIVALVLGRSDGRVESAGDPLMAGMAYSSWWWKRPIVTCSWLIKGGLG